MKKVALVFVVAVFVPSLILAWLAVRSLRDQQFVIERQQSLLYQGVTDSLAKDVVGHLSDLQHDFNAQVESLLAQRNPAQDAISFDDRLRKSWSLAEVGFCVTTFGRLLCPADTNRVEACLFYADNSAFLGNRESAEVYWNDNVKRAAYNDNLLTNAMNINNPRISKNGGATNNFNNFVMDNSSVSKAQIRNVKPVQQAQAFQTLDPRIEEQSLSKAVPAEAEFRQLIGEATDGMLARFLQNRLKLMFWHRLTADPQYVFGAQLDLSRVVDGLKEFVRTDPALDEEVCVVLLDDNARPMAMSHAGFSANWKRPFVASEIGDALPHWEMAAYLRNPVRLTQAAETAKLTLGLLIAVLVLAIGVGSWLIVACLNSELRLARQKTDFVSNVSHELKTPLTSIRMFSELLAEGRVHDSKKAQSYLNIITAEAGRLTRLINNVLDFSRMERGEKKYHFQECDLVQVTQGAAQTLRPHLESKGFVFNYVIPAVPVTIHGDTDALSQVLVNLLTNSEKYSKERREVDLELTRRERPVPYAEIRVMDRGSGVPAGNGEKIFEKFYRAHDSLSSGIEGSGLGLTIARQIARAHGGDVIYEPREGGGSCFVVRLPVKPEEIGARS